MIGDGKRGRTRTRTRTRMGDEQQIDATSFSSLLFSLTYLYSTPTRCIYARTVNTIMSQKNASKEFVLFYFFLFLYLCL